MEKEFFMNIGRLLQMEEDIIDTMDVLGFVYQSDGGTMSILHNATITAALAALGYNSGDDINAARELLCNLNFIPSDGMIEKAWNLYGQQSIKLGFSTPDRQKQIFTEMCRTIAAFNLFKQRLESIGLEFSITKKKGSTFDGIYDHAVEIAIQSLGKYDMYNPEIDEIRHHVMNITFEYFDREVEKLWQEYGKDWE